MPSQLALDRLSNIELLDRGVATLHLSVSSPAAEDTEPQWPPIAAETPGTIYVVQAAPTPAVKIGFTRVSECLAL